MSCWGSLHTNDSQSRLLLIILIEESRDPKKLIARFSCSFFSFLALCFTPFLSLCPSCSVEDKQKVATLTHIPKFLPEITIGAHDYDEKYYTYKAVCSFSGRSCFRARRSSLLISPISTTFLRHCGTSNGGLSCKLEKRLVNEQPREARMSCQIVATRDTTAAGV